MLQVYSTKRKELRGARQPQPGRCVGEPPLTQGAHALLLADVDVVPSRHWSASGSTGAAGQPSLLGLSLRLCHPQAALEQVRRDRSSRLHWTSLRLMLGSRRSGTCSKYSRAVPRRAQVRASPSASRTRTLTCGLPTGLVPFGDWIVGYAGGVLRGEGDFYDVVESVSPSRERSGATDADSGPPPSTSTSRCGYSFITPTTT